MEDKICNQIRNVTLHYGGAGRGAESNLEVREKKAVNQFSLVPLSVVYSDVSWSSRNGPVNFQA